MDSRRLRLLPLVAALVVAGCGADTTGATTTTTTLAPTTTTTTIPDTTTTTTTTTSPATTTTAAPGLAFYDVVLVAADDVLNVREAAGVDAPRLTVFLPDQQDVVATGSTEQVGSSLWREVETEDARGWVNGFFLTPVGAPTVDDWDAMLAVLDEFAAIIQSGGDLTPVVSYRGLHVVHHDPVRRFSPASLPTLLSDPTLQAWGGTGCSPEECPPATFSQAVANRFVGAYLDSDVEIAFDEVIPGPNGYIPEAIVPFEFVNFHYVAAHDPGDNPDYGGIDWSTWYAYFELEPTGWKIAALSVDEWAP